MKKSMINIREASKEVSIPHADAKRSAGMFWYWMAIVSAVAVLASLAVEYGFSLRWISREWLRLAQVVAVAGLLISKNLVEHHRDPFLGLLRLLWADVVIMALFIAACFVVPWFYKHENPVDVRWIVIQIYVMLMALLYLGRLTISATSLGMAPARVLFGSFAVIILAGAMILMLPAAHRTGTLSFTDAVFTSTSATCVTGLVVQDTGGDFTRMGQSIILALIQIGGLGIMIFGTLFAFLLGSPLSLRESVAMRDMMNEKSAGRIGRLVAFICIFTVFIELLAGAALYGMWQTDSVRGGQLFNSIFHAVSAFCNAGFSLHADSLTQYRLDVRVYMVIGPLIIIGGLGFPVLHNLYEWLMHRCFGRLSRSRAPVRISLHTKIVLTTTAVLIVTGWLTLWILEITRPDQKIHFSATSLLDSLFNSITARTAGFNTIDIGQRSAAAKLVLILLMCIGGSPASTAGGFKTVSLAVMMLLVVATMRHSQQINAFRRSVPVMIVRRAATLILLYVMLLWCVTLLLTITEHSHGTDMLDLLFEASSALGTVGLSTGVTGQLTLAGKWVIIIAMLIGRLGPLSLLTALSFHARTENYNYPKDMLVIS